MTPPLNPKDILAPGTPAEEELLGALARKVIGAMISGLPEDRRRRILANLETELAGRTNPDVVRPDCVWCGRERTRNDDNHAPGCHLWWLVEQANR